MHSLGEEETHHCQNLAPLRASGSKHSLVLPGWKRAATRPIRAALCGGYLLWIWTKNKALAAVLLGRTPAGHGKQCFQGRSLSGFSLRVSAMRLGYPKEWHRAGDDICNLAAPSALGPWETSLCQLVWAFAKVFLRVLLEIVWLRTDCQNLKLKIARCGVGHKMMTTCMKQMWWYPPRDTASHELTVSCSWLPRLSKQSYSQSNKDLFKWSLSQSHDFQHLSPQPRLFFLISYSEEERTENRNLSKWITKAEISALYHPGEMSKALP